MLDRLGQPVGGRLTQEGHWEACLPADHRFELHWEPHAGEKAASKAR